MQGDPSEAALRLYHPGIIRSLSAGDRVSETAGACLSPHTWQQCSCPGLCLQVLCFSSHFCTRLRCWQGGCLPSWEARSSVAPYKAAGL